MVLIKSRGDLYFGSFLLAVGALALHLSSGLSAGTAASMGAGYFPRLLAWLSIGFGAVIAVRGLLVEGAVLEAATLRPPLMVSLATTAFMLVDHVGLAVAVMAVTLIAGLGDSETRWRQNALLSVLLGAFAVLVFAFALRIPFPVWPRWPMF